MVCVACAQPTATKESAFQDKVIPAGESPVPEVDQTVSPTEESQQVVVYVTQEGDKYHTADCRYSKTAVAVKLSQAKTDGKTACGICKPNSKTGEKQLRCTSTTTTGKRCQRMTTDSSGKCFQHRDS